MNNVWTAQRIKSLRLRLGWSVAELSRRLGCSPDLVGQFEKGDTSPAQDDVLQMDRLEFHLDTYVEVIAREPQAAEAMQSRGLDQIHQSNLKNHLS